MRGYTYALAALAPIFAQAQLSGSVGPLVDYTTKAKHKTCDVTDYGAVADGKKDIGNAILSAWKDCAAGGLIYIPPGEYSLKQELVLSGGKSTAIQLDGVISRGFDSDYQLFLIRDSKDFEFFSGNSKGAIQGYGYKYLRHGKYGARLFRFQNVQDFSVHGFAAIDSPSYYFVFDTCSNGEIYNVLVRGVSELGATDAFDVWGENIWVHDIEVTNGDECVTVKSPARHFLIEDIYCNLSGGTAIGSLGLDTDIKDIHYRNLYMNQADPAYLKTHNGDGTVENVLWENVIVHGGPYTLALNAAWGDDVGGKGVQLSNLTFRNWRGENADNSRPVIRLDCDKDVPCYDITIEDVNLWTEDGDHVEWSCQNAYGSGACLETDTAKMTRYSTTKTVTKTPSYSATTMPHDLASALPSDSSFSIPSMPTSFFPGETPISKLLSMTAAGGL
ncbi:pectin lyase fold/virulence factor [Aspergillus carlsbadensis]|nr:pectin lyase fold/virulence factor [Aspergillus carlsbadensis]